MFDPTIYENLKVVLEGAIYDLDMTGQWSVMGRWNLVDLASMSRRYEVRLRLSEAGASADELWSSVRLQTEAVDLLSEITESRPLTAIGCQLTLKIAVRLRDSSECEAVCAELKTLIGELWSGRPKIGQSITRQDADGFRSTTIVHRLDFDRKINEDQIDDLVPMLEQLRLTMARVHQWRTNRDDQK